MKRSLVCVLIVAFFILSLPSALVYAQSEKKPLTPPELKSITFIHYAKPDKPGKPVKPDDPLPPEVDNSAYKLLMLYLPDTTDYYINPSGAPEGAFDEVGLSFETWDSVVPEELFSPAQQTSAYGLRYDGQNTISWVKIAPPKTIGLTRLWYMDDGNPDTFDPITEFDVAFNSFLAWGIDPDDEGSLTISKAYDIQNIATHEAGHVVGLADLYEEQYRELTMYGYGRTGETIKLSLEEGDEAGAYFIYTSIP